MLSTDEIIQLIHSLIWLLAGVGVFIVGMNFMSEALEKSAGEGMKKMLGRISNNRLSGVGIGAGVTAIIQSSSATSVMVIGLVNAGVMTLMQAVPIIMGANIGTTITGVLIALKNDYFNMLMYVFAFAGVMMGFFKQEKIKIAGLLCSGLGLIFVGLNVMSSEQAFGNSLVESLFLDIFSVIDFPLLLILVGIVFTALLQSSSAATGVVITMVGTGVLSLDLALFIVLGANIGTCVTALLASVGASPNAKRVALVHFTFNVIGTVFFTAIVWLFKEPIINLLVSLFPGNDPMSLQMRVSVFHVIFNVTTTCLLLPFVKQLVQYSCQVVKDRRQESPAQSLKYIDERLLAMPSVALMQVKKEIDYMLSLGEENIRYSLVSIESDPTANAEKIAANEETIDFTNSALTQFLIKLSACVDERDEQKIGSYFHVLNDLERVGDHAENFHEIGEELRSKKLMFSDAARSDIQQMYAVVIDMIAIAKEAFDSERLDHLTTLAGLDNQTDEMKRAFSAKHFSRLSEGNCSLEVSPYYTSAIIGLERVADHITNVGNSICNPVGDDIEKNK